MKLFQITIFILILVGANFAQNKIGFINGYEFYDEKSGIKKLVEAIKMTYEDDFITPQISKRAEELKIEIENLKKLGKSTEIQDVKFNELKEKLNAISESKKKRYTLLVGLIEKQINDKLELFANKNGYKKIFNIVDLEESLLYIEESAFVTNEFIKFCNEEFEKEKVSK